MLYYLTFFIGIVLLTQSLVFADDRGVSFFKAEDTKEDCKGCIKEGSILSIDLKKKVEEVEKETSRSFASKGLTSVSAAASLTGEHRWITDGLTVKKVSR